MGIEIVKNYQFGKEEELEENYFDNDKDEFDFQSGQFDLGLIYQLQWFFHFVDYSVEVHFLKKYNGTKEIKTLSTKDPIALFQDFWRPYNRISLKIEIHVEKAMVQLNGIRCVRRERSSPWSCFRYNDISLFNW